jgi:hypothetical protein
VTSATAIAQDRKDIFVVRIFRRDWLVRCAPLDAQPDAGGDSGDKQDDASPACDRHGRGQRAPPPLPGSGRWMSDSILETAD